MREMKGHCVPHRECLGIQRTTHLAVAIELVPKVGVAQQTQPLVRAAFASRPRIFTSRKSPCSRDSEVKQPPLALPSLFASTSVDSCSAPPNDATEVESSTSPGGSSFLPASDQRKDFADPNTTGPRVVMRASATKSIFAFASSEAIYFFGRLAVCCVALAVV